MLNSDLPNTEFDAIVIGSGFGGSMVAFKLVNAGMKVLMLERGNWVPRGPHNWADNGSVDLTEYYSWESPYRALAGGNKPYIGSYSCVGGPSVFYGGVSLRFRQKDFQNTREIVGDSGAEWPYSYEDLEVYYSEAEKLLNVAGVAGQDPTEPAQNRNYSQNPAVLSQISQKIKRAGEKLGLHPFHLPLAINYSNNEKQSVCINCTTCDTFACAISAKNDLATILIPDLIKKGMSLLPNAIVTKLDVKDKQIESVICFDKTENRKKSFTAKYIILSAGSLSSPHMLLSSGLQEHNPGGQNVGRFLMRHVNAIVFGIFPSKADKEDTFHKQLAFHDFYFGHSTIAEPQGKLGSIQQLQSPPAGLVRNELPRPFGNWLSPAVKLLTGLLVIAEDQPQSDNQVALNWQKKDKFGLPELTITHHYSDRDLAAIGVLKKKAKQILRKTGAWFFYVHDIRTFSHAVGTVRMGKDPKTSVLDEFCQFRGIDNFFVVDGSFMPTSAGLNPSLTISANALRVGEYIVSKN
jgi:choline dehydrogenase-like flavoprotein